MVVERCELVNIIKMPMDVGTLHYAIIVAFVSSDRSSYSDGGLL